MRAAVLFAVVFLVLGLATPAWAHATATSSVILDLQDHAIAAELELPLDQLAMARGTPLDRDRLAAEDAALRDYLLAHVRVTTADGAPFAARVGSLSVATTTEAGDVLRATMTFTGTTSGVLADDAILHRVVTHRILVSVRRDFERGQLAATSPRAIGVIGWGSPRLVLDRAGASRWSGMRAVFRLGMTHIADGTDHLLFVIVLLLGAPLRDGKSALRRIVAIVSSFTIGHSISLAAATFGWVTLPSRPVEVAIAVSIVVTAVHAVRPLLPGKEPLVGGLFGLVHGLAFASALGELGLHGTSLGLALVSFNAGIEAMQLAVVLVVAPLLVLLARRSFYEPVRRSCAALAGLTALAWVAQRLVA